ncbi:MAG: 50S ribosomal protein L4, partial [Spirochaetes bacterium]|nr:50S ribosomal protein L4 [Spirochaetota bacterium]
QFRHGGVAFGPTPHSYRQELPVAKRRLALAMALSTKLSEGNLVVLEDLKVSEPKTKAFAAVLETLSAGRKPLLLGNFADANTKLAGRNIAGLTHLLPEDINAYVVLNSTKVIMTKEALEKISATFTKEAK